MRTFAVTQPASNEYASRRLFLYVRTVLVSAIASSVIGICASSRRRGLIVTADAHLHLVAAAYLEYIQHWKPRTSRRSIFAAARPVLTTPVFRCQSRFTCFRSLLEF